MNSSRTTPDQSQERRGVVWAIRQSLALLIPSDRIKYALAIILQMLLSGLDLLGVLLIALVGALAVTGVAPGASLPSYASTAIERLGLQGISPLTLAVYLAVFAASFLVIKSLASLYLVRRVLLFLAGRQGEVASRLAGQLFAQPLTIVQRRTSQLTAYALMEGTTVATVDLLGALCLALGDIALLTVLTVALLIIDPLITLFALIFFVCIALLLQKVLGSIARKAGTRMREASVEGLGAVQEGFAAYREITVSSRRSLFRDRISGHMWVTAGSAADIQYVAQVPKYVFETALVVGALVLVISQSANGDAATAAGSLALFLAAGARVMPSLLRLQVSLINIRQAETRALPTYELEAELRQETVSVVDFDMGRFTAGCRNGWADFEPSLEINCVSYTYPSVETPTINNVSVNLDPGQSLALVGPTGAGKSTLADLVLGVLHPESGSVLIGGHRPAEAASLWPGALAYVPQSVGLVAGTVRDNVALGISRSEVDDEQVWEALQRAHLDQLMKISRDGLETVIGERGLKLSGGQRQRLGIARALYSRPLFLVLDEATSALDAETEAAVTAMLADLSGYVTIVSIAHRLATVRKADLLLYMENGCVVEQGKFDEIRTRHSGFDRQARLLGL